MLTVTSHDTAMILLIQRGLYAGTGFVDPTWGYLLRSVLLIQRGALRSTSCRTNFADSDTSILQSFRQMTSHGGRVGPMLAELKFRARRLRRGAAVSIAAPTGRLGSLPSVPVRYT